MAFVIAAVISLRHTPELERHLDSRSYGSDGSADLEELRCVPESGQVAEATWRKTAHLHLRDLEVS